jgi:hypothetical protein
MWKCDPHFLNPDISGSYVEIVISYLISYHMFVDNIYWELFKNVDFFLK